MDPVTIELTRLAVSIAAFVLAAGANVYAWWATKSKARRDEVDEELDKMRERVQAVERDLHHSPSQEQIHHLHNRIGEVHGELKQMSGKLDGINRLADLMNEHLINEGRSGR